MRRDGEPSHVMTRLGWRGLGRGGDPAGSAARSRTPARGAGFSRPRTYLLLHPALKQHRHTGLDGEGDLPAADHEMLLQRLSERRLLHPGL